MPEVRFLHRWLEVSHPLEPIPWSHSGPPPTACLSSHQAAWHAGFDVDGCAQLGGSLAGRSIWIGPSEVVALLRSFQVKAVLISARGEDQASSDIYLPAVSEPAMGPGGWLHDRSPSLLAGFTGYGAAGVPQELSEKEGSTAIVDFVRRWGETLHMNLTVSPIPLPLLSLRWLGVG